MGSGSHRERLYDVFADPDDDTEATLVEALEVGTEYLDLPLGFVTRIEDGTQEVVVATGDHESIRPGATCPLEDAYCRQTLERDSPLAAQTAETEIDQRAIDAFGLGTYIGAKITVDGDVYGTVCFAAETARDVPFSDAEELFLELLAKLVGGALERREHERELQARNERLRREKQRFEGIAETSFDILFRLGLDAQFTYVSSAVERVLGYDPEELVGESFADFMTDASAERALVAYQRLRARQPVENVELDFLDDSGDVVVVEVNASPVVEGGTPVGVQGVGRDVTARKERQRELHLKNRAMDEARVGISIADVNAAGEPLVYVNEGFERLTGYAADDAVGRNCRFLQGSATDPDAIDRMRRALDAGDSVDVELINYRADGTPFWNAVRLTPVEDERGTVTHYVGFQEDVTGRKRTEQLIQILNRVLRHNLRNDMNALLGWNDLRPVTDDADDADGVTTRVRRIAEDLLDVSDRARELERYARRERTPTRLDPDAVLAAVAEAHAERWPDSTLDVSVRSERGICAGRELERAVAELVTNAAKHDPSPDTRIEIDVADAGEWVAVTVSDDGPGIDEMEAAVVAAGNETALQHGSGLGLWLVNWIVTRYGGSFGIEANADEGGTTATIRLPGIDAVEAVDSVARRPTVLFR